MKTCRKCLESKDHSEFHRSSANKDGLQSYCKRCLSRYVTERRISQPLAKTDAQREKNRIYARLYRYGLSKEKFESMLEEQGNACAVCSTEFSDEVKPHVDHDHKCCVGNKTCGKCVRGLLCMQCNIFAGMIETRFSTHEKMFSYLHLHHNSLWGTINLKEQNQIN